MNAHKPADELTSGIDPTNPVASRASATIGVSRRQTDEAFRPFILVQRAANDPRAFGCVGKQAPALLAEVIVRTDDGMAARTNPDRALKLFRDHGWPSSWMRRLLRSKWQILH